MATAPVTETASSRRPEAQIEIGRLQGRVIACGGSPKLKGPASGAPRELKAMAGGRPSP